MYIHSKVYTLLCSLRNNEIICYCLFIIIKILSYIMFNTYINVVYNANQLQLQLLFIWIILLPIRN